MSSIQFLVAALGGIEQIAQHGLAVAQELDPAILLLHPLGIGRAKLPSVEKRFDQRLERLGPGLEREEAPAAALLKGLRPCAGRARPLGPCLALERRKHARLCERRLAHTRIAEQHRELVRRGGERRDYINRFPLPAEEVVAVLLLHRGKASVR